MVIQPIILPNFSWKLHGNERIWTQRGRASLSPLRSANVKLSSSNRVLPGNSGERVKIYDIYLSSYGLSGVTFSQINLQNIKEWRISLWWLVWGRNVTFHAVLCSYMWTVHITLCAVELQWHKMYRKCPQHPSSSLLTTAAEEKQTSHRLLFLLFFGFFTTWYECISDRFDCRICCDSHAGIFKWILMIFFEKLCQIWRNLD